MARTTEQIAADRQLEDAIDNAAKAYGILNDDELGEPAIRSDFIVIVEGLSFDDSGDLDCDFYGLLFPNGSLPGAKAKGMCHQGLHLLDHGRRMD